MIDHFFIETKKISKNYHEKKALVSVNLSLAEGQFIALIGPNGSGKSTLMRLLSLREPLSFGEIFYLGKNLNNLCLPYLENLMYLTEDLELPISESIIWWKNIFEKKNTSFSSEKFSVFMEKFNLNPAEKIDSLSRGQKVKALFSLKAAMQPKIYILDEITATMDAGSRWYLMEFLDQEVKNNKALVVMSTNIASEMNGFASQICVMSNGQVELFCAKSEIGAIFDKLRIKKEDSDLIKIVLKLGARKISVNADGSYCFIIKKNMITDCQIFDRREITIEEVAIYFTASTQAVKGIST